MRYAGVKGATLAGCMCALAACGTDGGAESRPKPIFNNEVRCLSCEADPSREEQKQLDPKPRVIVAPAELFFYPDGQDSPELEPKAITVINATANVVAVLYAMVGEDADAAGGAEFFRLTPFEAPVWLEPDGKTVLWVTYLGSEKQQSALVAIYTSALETPLLQVPLTGKFFFSD